MCMKSEVMKPDEMNLFKILIGLIYMVLIALIIVAVIIW